MTNSNEAEGKHKPSPKPVDSLDELVERLELWCTLREPLPTVKYSSVRELLAASLHYSRAALVQQCSHSALLAENAALQRQLELAEATHGDEAFAGALSDEMAKSRHEALTARCEKLEAMMRRYASECGECDGSGQMPHYADRDTEAGRAEPMFVDCTECSDIRALLSDEAAK